MFYSWNTEYNLKNLLIFSCKECLCVRVCVCGDSSHFTSLCNIVQVCATLYKFVQICTSLYKVPWGSNALHELSCMSISLYCIVAYMYCIVQVSATLYKSLQHCTSLCNIVQVCATLQVCTSLFKFVQVCKIFYKFVQVCISLYKGSLRFSGITWAFMQVHKLACSYKSLYAVA